MGFAPSGQFKRNLRPLSVTELDSDALVTEVKRLRGKKHPLTTA